MSGRPLVRWKRGRLLEVALQQALERLAVTRLVLRHLVDGVVDGVVAELLRTGGDRHLAGGRPALRIDAGVSRLRPVANASLTTVLGMIPLLTDAFYCAMAVTIMAGLAFATVLTMIVIPVNYALIYRIRK